MWTALGLILCVLPLALIGGLIGYISYFVRKNLLHNVERAFVEKPLFIIPRGEPDPNADGVRFKTADGRHLQGAYFKTSRSPRKGVILFGIEYGSDRWSCRSYCDPLLSAGYDVFAYEPRNQGKSDSIPGYEPLPWITNYEVEDARAALAYLKSRPDADRKGVGLFGVSKGANAGLAVAAEDPWIRCVVTDGAFGLVTVMLPYMRHWIRIYNKNLLVHGLMPAWYYSHMAQVGIRRVQRTRKVRFFQLEFQPELVRQPLLMIHGEADSYIKVEMARALFRRATGPKVLWAVPGAKHNLSITVAGDEYARRVVEFFDRHLAGVPIPQSPVPSHDD
jgi:pimeloyl-ACP methyl ester carboxylesterase